MVLSKEPQSFPMSTRNQREEREGVREKRGKERPDREMAFQLGDKTGDQFQINL